MVRTILMNYFEHFFCFKHLHSIILPCFLGPFWLFNIICKLLHGCLLSFWLVSYAICKCLLHGLLFFFPILKRVFKHVLIIILLFFFIGARILLSCLSLRLAFIQLVLTDVFGWLFTYFWYNIIFIKPFLCLQCSFSFRFFFIRLRPLYLSYPSCSGFFNLYWSIAIFNRLIKKVNVSCKSF